MKISIKFDFEEMPSKLGFEEMPNKLGFKGGSKYDWALKVPIRIGLWMC